MRQRMRTRHMRKLRIASSSDCSSIPHHHVMPSRLPHQGDGSESLPALALSQSPPGGNGKRGGPSSSSSSSSSYSSSSSSAASSPGALLDEGLGGKWHSRLTKL